jgi:hypothetical protein
MQTGYRIVTAGQSWVGLPGFVMPEAALAAIRHLRAGTAPKIPDKRLTALSGMTNDS